MKRLRKKSAFSLVEVVLAMGVASFALTAMMGTLSLGLGSSKASTDDTVRAVMVSDIVGGLRRQRFVDAQSYVQAAPAIYFDVYGNRLKNPAGTGDLPRNDAIAAGAIYQCTQTAVADSDTSSANGDPNLLRVALTFAWPAAAITPANTKVVHATIARY